MREFRCWRTYYGFCFNGSGTVPTKAHTTFRLTADGRFEQQWGLCVTFDQHNTSYLCFEMINDWNAYLMIDISSACFVRAKIIAGVSTQYAQFNSRILQSRHFNTEHFSEAKNPIVWKLWCLRTHYTIHINRFGTNAATNQWRFDVNLYWCYEQQWSYWDIDIEEDNVRRVNMCLIPSWNRTKTHNAKRLMSLILSLILMTYSKM